MCIIFLALLLFFIEIKVTKNILNTMNVVKDSSHLDESKSPPLYAGERFCSVWWSGAVYSLTVIDNTVLQ